MSCYNSCCKHFHKITSINLVDGNAVISATNTSTLPSDGEKFCLAVCQNANTISLTAIPVLITINGANCRVYNKFSKVMTSTELATYTRKMIKGYFVLNGSDNYVIFNEVPKCGV